MLPHTNNKRMFLAKLFSAIYIQYTTRAPYGQRWLEHRVGRFLPITVKTIVITQFLPIGQKYFLPWEKLN